MALREQMLDARAWGPVVRLEGLICDLQGLRNGRIEEGLSHSSPVAVPSLSIEQLRERAPLLIEACARIGANTEDEELLDQIRAALSRSLARLEAQSGT